MSPETTTTGRRDFVQAVAEKVRRDISSMGPKEPPKAPPEPKISEGTVDLAEHSKIMGEHREQMKAYEENQHEYDEAQAKREEAGQEYSQQFQSAQTDVDRLLEEREDLNPRDRDKAERYSEEVGAVAETTVKYLIGVQEGIISFDHITDPEVRSFAERAVKTIAEKALKIADPSTVLESYKIIQQLSSGELDMDALQSQYTVFRDVAARLNRGTIPLLANTLINTFDGTEEDVLQEVFHSTQEKNEIMDRLREGLTSDIPDLTGQDAIDRLLTMEAVAGQVMEGGRLSEASITALHESVITVLDAVKKGKIDLTAQFPDGDDGIGQKLRDYASDLLNGISTSGLAQNAHYAAHLYPVIAEIMKGEVSLDALSKTFDSFARTYGLDAEKDTQTLADVFKNAALSELDERHYERFTGEPGYDRDTFREKINRLFDLEAISPYSMLEQKYGKIMEVYTDVKDKKLLRAIFDADEYLEGYLEGMKEELVEKVGRDHKQENGAWRDGWNDERAREEASKQLSLTFKDEVALLFGKLFKTVDEEAPATYWSEAVQEGDMWTQTANLAATFKKSLERVRDLKFKEGSIVQELLWTRRGEEYRLPKEASTASGKTEEMVRYSSTYKKDIRLRNWQEYMLLVSKGVAAMEGIKRYVHDARATQYNPAPEGGHLGQLKQFADSHMSSLDFDSFYELPDNAYMMEGAQLWDAMSRIQLAETNWVIPSSGDVDHESGVPVADKLTLQYMMRYKGAEEGELEEWRVRQAVSLGAGHHFTGMSLSGIMGAWADAPQDLSGKHEYRSYGMRDSEAYAEINPLRHILHRFRASGMNTTILYTPIGRITETGEIEWGHIQDLNKKGEEDGFSYESLQDAEKRFKDATTKGKAKEDLGIIRPIDIMNPGKLGDAVSRGGWRDLASVDHWYVDRLHEDRRLSVLEGLVANEHIGPEYLKKYLTNIVGGNEQTKPFFKAENVEKDKKTEVEMVKRENLNGAEAYSTRREVVDYLLDRYYKDEYAFNHPGDENGFAFQTYKEQVFEELEHGGEADKKRWAKNKKTNGESSVKKPEHDTADDLKYRYQRWFMNVSARAMMLQDPTLFLTIERNNEAHGRSRAWDQVKKMVEQTYANDVARLESEYNAERAKLSDQFKDEKDEDVRRDKIQEQEDRLQEELNKAKSSKVLDPEKFRHAVEDLAAVSAAVTRQCRDKKWELLDAGETWVHQIKLGTDDFVTEDKIREEMGKMQERGLLGASEEEARARIERTVAVFKANREFSYGNTSVDGKKIVNEAGMESSFIDAMGFKLKLPWPVGFHRAIGVGSVDFRALALREAGSRMPARVLGDASSLAQNVAKPMGDFVGKLVEVAGMEDRKAGNEELAKLMKQAQHTMSGIHGRGEGFEITSAIMTPMAVRMFRADSNALHIMRAGYGRLLESLDDRNIGNAFAGKYRSLSEAVVGASNWHGARVDKPEDTRAMLDYFADPQVGTIPQSVYDSAVPAHYVYDEMANKVRRGIDFDELTLKDVAEKAKATRRDVLKKWAKMAPLYLAAGGAFAILASLVRGLKRELGDDARH